jgi:hypothetical protein
MANSDAGWREKEGGTQRQGREDAYANGIQYFSCDIFKIIHY